MSTTSPKQPSSKPAPPAPKLPQPKIPHEYIETGIGGGRTKTPKKP